MYTLKTDIRDVLFFDSKQQSTKCARLLALLHILFIWNENFKLLLTVTPKSATLETDWIQYSIYNKQIVT